MTTQQNGVRRVWLNAGTASEFFPASARMFFQSTTDCDVYGSNNPSAGSELLGSVVAGTASAIETGYGYISLVSVAPGECAVSYVSAGATASGGGGGGGGGGGAVTIADGADIAQGARAQTAATDDTGAWSLVQLTKRLLTRMATSAKQDTTNARLSRMGGLAMAETEEDGSTVYVMHRSSIDSAMAYVVVRYVTTGGAVAIRYAGVVNNPTMTTSALAWTNRATLVYGSLAEA